MADLIAAAASSYIVKATTEAITETAQAGFALRDVLGKPPVATAAADLVGALLGALLGLTGAILHCSQAVAAGPKSDEWAVRSTSTAGNKLKIVLADGRVVAVPPADHQCSFDDITIAPDGRTVGWTEGVDVEYAGDKVCDPHNEPGDTGPIIWRAGKIIRSFPDAGAVLIWSFVGKGDLVASHAGPAHFDNSQEWILYDIVSGRKLKHWDCSEKKPPAWASPDLGLCN